MLKIIMPLVLVFFSLQSCQVMMDYEAKRLNKNKTEALEVKKQIQAKKEKENPVEKKEPEFDPYAGLNFTELPLIAKTKEDLDKIILQYSVFIESEKVLVIDIKALGVSNSRDKIDALAQSTALWTSYFKGLRIVPDKPVITKEQLTNFYASLESRDQVSKELQNYINSAVNKERTHQYSR